MSNNVGITALQGGPGTVLLKSFYVGINNGPIDFRSSGLAEQNLEILDKYGYPLHTCTNATSCSVDGIIEGLFYARITGATEFVDATLKATWGGATDTTLENSVPKSIQGNHGDVIIESVHLPISNSALMVQGPEYAVDFEVTDSEGANVGDCYGNQCSASNLPAGIYYIKAYISEDGLRSKLVASWGSANGGTITNGELVKGLQVDEREWSLQSFYLPEGATNAMVQLSEAAIDAQVLDRFGNELAYCFGGQPCQLDQVAPGVYFIRVTAAHDELQPYSLSLAWGGIEGGTLANGELLTGLQVERGEWALQSFYLPESATNAMVQLSEAVIDAQVLDRFGNELAYCFGGQPCQLDQVAPGVYFIRVTAAHDELQPYSLSLAWGGIEGGTLANGELLTGLQVERGEWALQSFYLPESATNAMVQLSEAVIDAQVLDRFGNELAYCFGGQPCQLDQVAPGVYFVRVTTVYDEMQSYSLSASWVGVGIASLSNAVPVTGISGELGDAQLQSVYLAEPNNALTVSANNPFLEIELLDGDGFRWRSCVTECTVDNLPEGSYFVKLSFTGDVTDAELTATWE